MQNKRSTSKISLETSSGNSKVGPNTVIILFKNRTFALIWFGRTVSVLGDFLFNVTLTLWIVTQIAKNQPWAPLAVSGVQLAVALPTLALGLLAGVLVDRWEKRKVLLYTDALNLVMMTLLFLCSGFISLPFLPEGRIPLYWLLALIYLTVFLNSTFQQFSNPSSMTLILESVEESDRAEALGMIQITVSAAIIIGPPLATLLFFAVGPFLTLLLNALSFGISFLAISVVKAQVISKSEASKEPAAVLDDLLTGLRFSLRSPIILVILVTTLLSLLGRGTISALGIFFLRENLHVDEGYFGYLGMAAGIGSLLGAFFFTFLVQRLGIVRVFCWRLLLEGLLQLVYARLSNVHLVIGVTVLLGVMDNAGVVTTTPLITHATPKALLGRVLSIYYLTLSSSMFLSVGFSGFVASTILRNFQLRIPPIGITFGRIDTIFIIGGLLVLLSGVYATLMLHNVQLKSEGEREANVLQRGGTLEN